MLTKEQKKVQVQAGSETIKKSQTLVLADFSGIAVEDIRKLKVELKKAGASFKVIKKRLLKIALKEAGVDFDPMQFDAQVGVVFAPEDLSSVAAPIYKFSKEQAKAKKDFKVLGVYDLAGKAFLPPEEFVVIAKLPSREILLAMVMGAATGPLRAFMYLLDQLSKRTPDNSAKTEEAPATSESAAKPDLPAEASAKEGGEQTVEQKS